MAETSSIECELPLKKPHLEISEKENKVSIHKDLKDLSNFTIDEVLTNNASRKLICLKGTFKGLAGVGIVLLEKTAFDQKILQEGDFLETSSLKQVFHNDIYGNYECLPKVDLNTIKTTIIHPATEKHLKQYSTQIIYIVNETPEVYKDIVAPTIEEGQFTLEWVYNILEHKSEHGRIVYEDEDAVNGFVLLPDLKWDGKTVETLYLLAIPHVRNIKSLRDLNSDHLPLLKNIYEAGCKAIKDKFGLESSRLRIYLHYQPSFYHLHVHFTFVQYDSPGVYTERSHLLTHVISNIELLPDYYQKVSLPFTVRESDKLFLKLEEKKIVTRQNDNKTNSN